MDGHTGVSLKMEVEEVPVPSQTVTPIKIEPILKCNYNTGESSDSSDEMSAIDQYHEYVANTHTTYQDSSELMRQSDSDEVYDSDSGEPKFEPVESSDYVIYQNVQTDSTTGVKTVALVKCSGSVAIVSDYGSKPDIYPDTDSFISDATPAEAEHGNPVGPELCMSTSSPDMAEEICSTLEHSMESPSLLPDNSTNSPDPSSNQSGKDAHMCPLCSKFFQTKRNLTAHHKRCHNDTRYPCDICGIVLKSKSYLSCHRRSHEGDKRFQCSVCNARFDREQSLRRHVRTHTGEKPYVCTVCGRGFATSGNLATHARLHTGETPYTCELCGVGFPRLESLKRHLAKHSGEKPFECTACGKRFLLTKDLKCHARQHNQRPQTDTTE